MQQKNSIGKSTIIKDFGHQQLFYLYQIATFPNLRLVVLPPTKDQQAFALLRIEGLNNHPTLKLSRQAHKSQKVKAILVEHASVSHYHSSSYECSLRQLTNEIIYDLDTKVYEVYQKLSQPQPIQLKARLEQGKATLDYFRSEDLLLKKQALENDLLLDSACKTALDLLKVSHDQLRPLHTLSFYGQEAFGRLRTYQLTRYLDRYLRFSPDQYEKNKNELLSYLSDWNKDWDVNLEQQLFAQMAEAYFSRTKAKYLSNATIDQIQVTNKSYTDLGALLYPNTLLAQPENLKKLLRQDLATVKKTLNQDLAFRFLNQVAQDLDQKLQPLYVQERTNFQERTRQLIKAKRAFYQEKWTPESNGSQRIHFTTLFSEDDGKLASLTPSLPNTDMAPILDLAGAVIGFQPEDKVLNMAYTWGGKAHESAQYPVLTSAELLEYLEKGPAFLLEELKKAP